MSSECRAITYLIDENVFCSEVSEEVEFHLPKYSMTKLIVLQNVST